MLQVCTIMVSNPVRNKKKKKEMEPNKREFKKIAVTINMPLASNSTALMI